MLGGNVDIPWWVFVVEYVVLLVILVTVMYKIAAQDMSYFAGILIWIVGVCVTSLVWTL
jgi:hypothetical protein